MDWHEILKISGGVLALLMYVPLIPGALRDNGAGQSFAMWALWAVLDTTITISLIVQRGNFWLTAGFGAGSIVLAALLLWKGRFAWGRLETVIAMLVLVCLCVWKFSGPKGATVATTVAIFIAGLPGLVELWRNPQPAIARVWAGYTVANLLAFAGGAAWSIEERFAPGVFAVQTLALVAVGFRERPATLPAPPPGT
jgi:hypothetical protein